MSAKLTAYYGGSGMWDVRSADGKRAYSVVTSGRGKVRITNRRGDVLNPNGPTAAEVLRAMNAARKTTARQAENARQARTH